MASAPEEAKPAIGSKKRKGMPVKKKKKKCSCGLPDGCEKCDSGYHEHADSETDVDSDGEKDVKMHVARSKRKKAKMDVLAAAAAADDEDVIIVPDSQPDVKELQAKLAAKDKEMLEMKQDFKSAQQRMRLKLRSKVQSLENTAMELVEAKQVAAWMESKLEKTKKDRELALFCPICQSSEHDPNDMVFFKTGCSHGVCQSCLADEFAHCLVKDTQETKGGRMPYQMVVYSKPISCRVCKNDPCINFFDGIEQHLELPPPAFITSFGCDRRVPNLTCGCQRPEGCTPEEILEHRLTCGNLPIFCPLGCGMEIVVGRGGFKRDSHAAAKRMAMEFIKHFESYCNHGVTCPVDGHKGHIVKLCEIVPHLKQSLADADYTAAFEFIADYKVQQGAGFVFTEEMRNKGMLAWVESQATESEMKEYFSHRGSEWFKPQRFDRANYNHGIKIYWQKNCQSWEKWVWAGGASVQQQQPPPLVHQPAAPAVQPAAAVFPAAAALDAILAAGPIPPPPIPAGQQAGDQDLNDLAADVAAGLAQGAAAMQQ